MWSISVKICVCVWGGGSELDLFFYYFLEIIFENFPEKNKSLNFIYIIENDNIKNQANHE